MWIFWFLLSFYNCNLNMFSVVDKDIWRCRMAKTVAISHLCSTQCKLVTVEFVSHGCRIIQNWPASWKPARSTLATWSLSTSWHSILKPARTGYLWTPSMVRLSLSRLHLTLQIYSLCHYYIHYIIFLDFNYLGGGVCCCRRKNEWVQACSSEHLG